eukprot:TRINITY_DN18708_c0_g1::TRINITY_DN18708_c0_g1_i1::g.20358::m.20358 TRINITY_DN18708_c0_g1::TRINITY_DN18708_c0_g1_i1::g.20358  ORF type:complete len:232 (+),score=15.26,sp/Q8BI21/RNF38_MOUSE/41.00/9e-16,zf-RING_2/PF13639.1/38,zf-RING_2/PF13639.1/1e+03,zf-RING_2/PF13639.1/2.3e+03,zf-RING_2/PF13639.1/1.2e-15,zf-C3HC4/PF00097.20/1.4e+02,zf-C3HC4/PF00097.20/1.9e+03,zf-C3HC4/PF00097.20/4.7e-07,zf-C3HC4_3/PF13920.1/6.4e+02,zf-C3HC4_3/PF13920.1/6.4e+02,zf-C3HC4_3/PF13920.1/2.9e+03,zf-C3HC4_3/PF13920.1/1e-
MGSSESREAPSEPSVSQTVQCPRCHGVLQAPPDANVFRCPCGVLLTTNPSYVTDPERGNPNSYPGESTASTPVASPQLSVVCPRCYGVVLVPPGVSRLLCPCGQRLAVRRPEAQVFVTLPRNSDGTIRLSDLERLAENMLALERGASQNLIDLLPTHTFHASHSTEEETHKQCMVCLMDYEEGDELRTLPCFHSFHRDCVDKWLLSNRICPVCKTSIDEIQNHYNDAIEAS